MTEEVFSQFTNPLLEQMNKKGFRSLPKGKYFEYLRWLTISVIKNDKKINNKPILSYIINYKKY